MDVLLTQSSITSGNNITISGSKSQTNRLLLLKALYDNLEFTNASDSDDSIAMREALKNPTELIDVHHAGTAMRFLTAYFSSQDGIVVTLTGSSRMQERPIGILVDALKNLGAEITYLNNYGYPPLLIKGRKLDGHTVSLPANVSSQYISALLLIAPKLNEGIKINLEGQITSRPYIEMSLSLLNKLGIATSFNQNTISVQPKSEIQNTIIDVESDWSSASYFYSIIALSPIGSSVTLSIFQEHSLQADRVLANLYTSFGVTTQFVNDGSIQLTKTHNPTSKTIQFDLIQSPDIAQTIAVTALGLKLEVLLNGLHTLKIKETDRLLALKTEIEKFGVLVELSESSIAFSAKNLVWPEQNIAIATYQDHRMAMSFAPLALKTNLIIQQAEVCSKSYPNFWQDLKSMGFQVTDL